MAIFNGELGLQFVTHLANQYTVPDLVRLARLAADNGFQQIWVNDNIRYRNQTCRAHGDCLTGTDPPRYRDHGALLSQPLGCRRFAWRSFRAVRRTGDKRRHCQG